MPVSFNERQALYLPCALATPSRAGPQQHCLQLRPAGEIPSLGVGEEGLSLAQFFSVPPPILILSLSPSSSSGACSVFLGHHRAYSLSLRSDVFGVTFLHGNVYSKTFLSAP